ncbi:hypothetical protein [Latilactobacillus sakei]|uniref:hypothetical protein n=1 Tax=Latilactobacillus sakei TaxID=1599 RepID=UPI000C12FA81|nr:hypothetical protein [Latilactobacillus sakei]SOB44955.1 protein of unknown function [Latilactobacillus sakei]
MAFEHYQVFLDINRAQKRFSGRTTITGTAKDAVVLIHQNGLVIETVSAAGKSVPFTVDNDANALKVEMCQVSAILRVLSMP